ncbi:FHA domain-containing protein [Hyalangium versicolor]|uniref:FHA domain-containing protein n=1 Tax=Hyalangium versicolor TaxID=2861190 RepID=UPI001CCA6A7A|nr:FHA domain-containing protein [Hyalangium versicolor]
MGFQLKIAEGKDAGKEFEFDQDSVLIGRTPECDVVLYDAGVSRKHCRIFSEGNRFLIEDMGSSNGTKLNGSAITRKQSLSDGDQLTLGPVVFVFGAMEEEEPAPEPNTDAAIQAPPPEGEGSTRIVSADKVKPRQKNKAEALKPEGNDAEPENLANLQRSSTRAMPSVRSRPGAGASRAGASSAAIERAAPASPAPRRPATSGAAAVERAAPPRPAGAAALSAAERARIKRESPGGIAQIKLFWLEASTNVRRGIIGGFVAMALLAVGGAYWFVMSQPAMLNLGNEPSVLGTQPISDVFGLGQGVRWQHADLKTFTWEYAAATRAVVIVHYQAQNISQGEVVVTVNGVDVGQVPPDTLASRDRSLELMVPPNLLKKGEVNRITFDNTKNPPAEDEWRIWNVWVEKALLPDLPPDQLEVEARNAYQRGRQNFQRADVGARNRYEAWKSFREAWLLLEAHPEPKPDLYFEARDRMKDAQQELDKTCAKLLLETEGYYNQKNFAAAKHTLEYIREYFPEFDQPCATHAENKRSEYGF